MQGTVKIISNFSSTMIIVLDATNNVVMWNSCMEPYATKKLTIKSYEIGKEIAFSMEEKGIRKVDVIIKGPGPRRKSLISALIDGGITINLIKDITPIPHNGVFPMKRIRKTIIFS